MATKLKKTMSYDRQAFGEFLRQRREELGISVRGLAAKIEMSPVYLSDIERSNRGAPTGSAKGIDYMQRLIEELNIGSDELESFFDMADASNEVSCNDVVTYVKNNRFCRMALRYAMMNDVPDEEWEELFKRYQSLNAESLQETET